MTRQRTPFSVLLWLGVVCFGVLVAWISVDFRLLLPELKEQFSWTDDPDEGRQLISRSREHMQEALFLLTDNPRSQETLANADFQMQLGYALMNVGLYRDSYPCVPDSMTRLDSLFVTLDANPQTPFQDVLQTLNPVLRCLTSVEENQWELRHAHALAAAERIDNSQASFIWVVGASYFMGVGLLVIYERQRRRTMLGLEKELQWMERALQDSLTGTHNRRAFDSDIERHFKRFQHNGRPLSLAMFDVDHFKAYNDTFGHRQGDEALCRVVEAINAILRPGEQIYRYGGEELALILTDCRPEDALAITERAIHAVEKLAIENPQGVAERLTISAGVTNAATRDPSPDTVINRADRALYRAKDSGRNRVCAGWPEDVA